MILGPVVVARFTEGGQDIVNPLLEAGIVGSVREIPSEGMVAIGLEASVFTTVFQPFHEDRAVARGGMVLSKKIPGLEKGVFSFSTISGGGAQIECELK